jgi:hypothetical protein
MMHRVVLLFFMSIFVGLAVAQPPVDYVLVCGDEVIGAASFVDEEWHVAVVVGATCDGTLSLIGPEDELDVVLDSYAGLVMVTIGEVVVIADEVPQPALDGMLTAQGNRGASAAGGSDGRKTAEAMVAKHQPEKPERPTPELPELPERPARERLELSERSAPELPELPEGSAAELPELPERPAPELPEPPALPDLPALPDPPEGTERLPELPEPAKGRRP